MIALPRGWALAARVAAMTAVVTAAGCGGGGSSPGAQPTGSSQPPTGAATSGPAASGPATAHLALVGTGGAAGAITAPTVQCNEPSLTGPQIRVFATAPGSGTTVMVAIHAHAMTVRYDSGSGAAYRERDFTGTGVTGFDPAHGVEVSSPLTESTPSSTNKGSLGAISSISGAITCGGQTQGSSTVAVSGTTTYGALSGVASPVDVECNATGALALGLMHAGSTAILVDLGLSATGVSDLLVTSGNPPVVYQLLGKNLVTRSGGTIHVPALDVKASDGSTLHVGGDATCGHA
jgi:hypothetical protein